MSLNVVGSLDTNIILRWLFDDVPAQTTKVDKLIGEGEFLRVSNLAIAEVVYILEAKGFTRSEIKTIIKRLCSQLNLYIERAVIVPAVELYEQHTSISFVDACLLYDATSSYAEPLYTFDKKLSNKDPKNIKLL